ncbi:MAG: hypothetical protein ABR589_12030, partial [Chthoniobacterales bacterium]
MIAAPKHMTDLSHACARVGCGVILLLSCAATALRGGPPPEGEMARGGGVGLRQPGPCIPAEEEARIRQEVSAYVASHPALMALPPPSDIARYPF